MECTSNNQSKSVKMLYGILLGTVASHNLIICLDLKCQQYTWSLFHTRDKQQTTYNEGKK